MCDTSAVRLWKINSSVEQCETPHMAVEANHSVSLDG